MDASFVLCLLYTKFHGYLTLSGTSIICTLADVLRPSFGLATVMDVSSST